MAKVTTKFTPLKKLTYFVYKYKKDQKQIVDLVAGFVNAKDAMEYGKQYIEGDFTDFVVIEDPLSPSSK